VLLPVWRLSRYPKTIAIQATVRCQVLVHVKQQRAPL
jgi:hypothetical protein